jgi:hypothetical protein
MDSTRSSGQLPSEDRNTDSYVTQIFDIDLITFVCEKKIHSFSTFFSMVSVSHVRVYMNREKGNSFEEG